MKLHTKLLIQESWKTVRKYSFLYKFTWKLKVWWNFKRQYRINVLKSMIPLLISEMTKSELKRLINFIIIYQEKNE